MSRVSQKPGWTASRREVLASVGGAAALAALPRAASAETPANYGPSLEVVKTFDDFALVGIAVSQTGRVFASAPSAKSGNRVIEVDAKSGAVAPYPDQSWNAPGADEAHRWSAVQAMWVDKDDHLWVLDSGSAVGATGPAVPPKLVRLDLATNKVIRSYGFEGVIEPHDSLNDVRVDLVHGHAYLSNIGNKGSIFVLDIESGKSRQVLVGDRSTMADAGEYLMLGPAVGRFKNGKIPRIHCDGIALSPDAQWLTYRPLTDYTYWRVPTSALIDATLAPQELSQKVEFLGTGVMSGGLIMAPDGTLYGGDLEQSTIVAMTIDAKTHELSSRLFVRAAGKLSWADGFAISGGDLYVADSHLWELPLFENHLPRSGPPTIFKMKLPT